MVWSRFAAKFCMCDALRAKKLQNFGGKLRGFASVFAGFPHAAGARRLRDALKGDFDVHGDDVQHQRSF